MQPPPGFIDHRIKIFDQLKAEYEEKVKCTYYHVIRVESECSMDRVTAQPREEIIITLPDGSERKGTSWETSPMDIAKDISKSMPERLVIAKVCVFWSVLASAHDNLG